MPDNYDIHLGNAREFYEEGNFEAARAAAIHAVQDAPPEAKNEARTVLAMALRRLELEDEAYRILDEIVKDNPSPEAEAEYALIRAQRGICDEICMEYAQKALDEDSDLASAHVALFWCLSAHNEYIDALRSLLRGMRRGADFSERRIFEIVRGWCQESCEHGDFQTALDLSGIVTDYFNTFDFLILHARLADLAQKPRVAVEYYKKSLVFLRPGPMRTDILEAIARIAI